MRQLMRTGDAVLLTFVESLLRDAGIETAILDRHASAMHGAFGIQHPRVLVAADRYEDARRVLTEAGLQDWIDDGGS